MPSVSAPYATMGGAPTEAKGTKKRMPGVMDYLYGEANMSAGERSRYAVDCRMVLVALLTFLSYAVYHAQRIGFSGIKTSMKNEAGFTKIRLGTMDMFYLFAYAFGQFVCGRAADLLSPKRALCFGMVICAALTTIEGCMGAAGIHGDDAGYVVWTLIRSVEGLVQATGWTSTVAIMGNWFPEDARGAVLGAWSSNANFGDIFGLHLGAFMLGSGRPWYAVLWAFGLIGFSMAIVNMLLLREAPHARSLDWQVEAAAVDNPNINDDIDDIDEAAGASAAASTKNEKSERVASFGEVLRIPGLLQYSVCYMFLKLVNYALFLWLPFYLKEGIGMEQSAAATMATMFDWGFIVGGFSAGLISDWTTRWARVPMRSPVVSIFLLLALLPLSVLRLSSSTTVISWMIFCSGVLQGGPAEALTSAVSVDMGKHPCLNGARATSTCTGVIDGIGAVGAAVGQFFVGMISEKFGWQAVFLFLIGSLAVSFALSLLRLRQELSVAREARSKAGVEALDMTDSEASDESD